MLNIVEEYAQGMMKRHPHLHEKWHYENGCFLLGLQALYETTGKQEYFDFIQKQMDVFINEKGQIATYKIEDFNLDQINQGRLLYFLYDQTGEERYNLASYQLRQQLKHQPRTAEGIFFHKKIYPDQVWLDGLYMASPYYAEFIKRYEYTKVYDDVILQFTGAYKNTLDVKTGLLRHAWDESRGQSWSNPITGQSPHTWGRALGWYLMALVDVLDILPEEVPGRGYLTDILNALIPRVLEYQDPVTKCWFQVMECGGENGNYPEASGSIMVVNTIAKAAGKGYIEKGYLEKAKEAYDGFVTTFLSKNEQGYFDIHGICGCAGLGSDPYRTGSFAYYVSEPKSANDFKCFGAFVGAGIALDCGV